ncbi:hypothetical protein H3T41_07405 [Lactobacillus sp. W8089]|nr:hypothetical protein [Lactobacillus sp. W8086]MBI0109517.1 hypothetical protein [Lactobacillus sp. W8085]MBI0112568.1 hypothetical protein [Lactobacillus sp. W8088]MBI0116284.1 hypothetical protein [Lactobacillus sp. W8087]MBI0120174.1 hypothetical protein [Lactobacillus sp. W8089]MBI0132139.1 hypothetical protein [Lactobacillus sp. W8090]
MSIKNLSKAASALALVGVVAPFLVQSAGAADDEPTSALSGVDGVTDPSGSEIIDSAAVSQADGTGNITGKSYAGIGFKSGDLILYQVPNFDFSMNNKIADDTYGLMTASPNGRMAVIVDNRYTATGAETGKYNWTLSAQADNFNYEGGSAALDSDNFKLLLNDSDGDKKADAAIQATTPVSQNSKGEEKKVYQVGTSLPANDDSVTLPKGVNILTSAPTEVASVNKSARPGATGLNFSNKYSAEFVVTANGILKIVPDKQYNSNITWTLTANPLH